MAYPVQVEERVESERTLSSIHQNGSEWSPLIKLFKAMGKVSQWTPMFKLVEDGLLEMFHADSCLIMLWDERSRTTLRADAFGPVEDHVIQPPKLGEVGLSDAVVELGRAIAVKEVLDSPYINKSRAYESPIQSMLGLPLNVEGQPLGVVLLGFNHPQCFTPAELKRAENFSNQVAVAMSQTTPLRACAGRKTGRHCLNVEHER